MIYTVYTDAAASAEKKRSGCAYVIFTDKQFVVADSVRVDLTYKPTHAEIIAIGLAAAKFIDKINVKPGDVVQINSDCMFAVDLCRQLMDNDAPVHIKSPAVKNSIQVLRQLYQKCNVTIHKVHGHKDVVNPNMFVDRLAKLPIRRD